MANIHDATQLILHSISDGLIKKDGSEDLRFDPDGIRFQLWDVNTDNLVACVKTYKDVLTWCSILEDSCLPELSANITKVVSRIANDGMSSISATSSENGKLIRGLLSNKQEQAITLTGEDSKGILQRLGGITGNKNNVED